MELFLLHASQMTLHDFHRGGIMTLVFLIVIGILGGLVSGLFGVGGGVIFGPLLMILLSYNVHHAIATSIAAIVPTALVATWRHAAENTVDWKAALCLAVFAAAGAWFGASLSLQLEMNVLRRVYAVFLFLLSIKLFFQN